VSQPSLLKGISSRDSGIEWNRAIRFRNWLEGNLGNFVEDRIRFPKLLLLQVMILLNFEHLDSFSSSASLFGV
jgi:hypothetical protein